MKSHFVTKNSFHVAILVLMCFLSIGSVKAAWFSYNGSYTYEVISRPEIGEYPNGRPYVKNGIGIVKITGYKGLIRSFFSIPASLDFKLNSSSPSWSDSNLFVAFRVTAIADDAFANCNQIKSLTLGNQTQYLNSERSLTIGCGAFAGCELLEIITFNNSFTYNISKYAFYGCKSLNSLTIPQYVISIGEAAFANCGSLEAIQVQGGNENYDSRDNCNAIIRTSTNELIAGCGTTIIPSSVTAIGPCAFKGSNLYRISIPNSVKSVGDEAFSGCAALTSVTIGNSVTSIGARAFEGCTGLTSITIPNSVTSISERAFEGCTGLTSITIPNSVTSIGDNAFSGCSGLTSITIPNSVTGIGNDAFNGCNGLKSVTIPTSVVQIGTNAFSHVQSLNLIGEGSSMPNSNGALPETLETLNIGSGITALGPMNVKPTRVNCLALNPPSCSENTFSDYSGTLNIPPASISKYLSHDTWRRFADFAFEANYSVSLNSTSEQMLQHDCLTLRATTSPAGAAIEWASNNPSVASVDANGKVTAHTEGNCQVKAYLRDFPVVFATCDVSVKYLYTLSEDTLRMRLDQRQKLSVITDDDLTSSTIVWSSSNSDVATVVDGDVHAVGAGQCDIIAKVNGRTLKCHVIVNGNIIISLEQSRIVIQPTTIYTITPWFDPFPTDITVSSSNPAIAVARLKNQESPQSGTLAPVMGNRQVQILGLSIGRATVTIASVDGLAQPASLEVVVGDGDSPQNKGDLTGDGTIDIGDLNMIIALIIQINNNPAADLNGDNKVDVSDLNELINIILGK